MTIKYLKFHLPQGKEKPVNTSLVSKKRKTKVLLEIILILLTKQLSSMNTMISNKWKL